MYVFAQCGDKESGEGGVERENCTLLNQSEYTGVMNITHQR